MATFTNLAEVLAALDANNPQQVAGENGVTYRVATLPDGTQIGSDGQGVNVVPPGGGSQVFHVGDGDPSQIGPSEPQSHGDWMRESFVKGLASIALPVGAAIAAPAVAGLLGSGTAGAGGGMAAALDGVVTTGTGGAAATGAGASGMLGVEAATGVGALGADAAAMDAAFNGAGLLGSGAATAPAAATAPGVMTALTPGTAAGATTAAGTVASQVGGGSEAFSGPGMDMGDVNTGLPASTPFTLGGMDLSKLTGPALDKFLSAITSGQGLAAALGAIAGIAGNGDMTSSRDGTSNVSTQGTSNLSSNTVGNSTGNTTGATANNAQTASQGQSQNSLAPWLQNYAQDYVARADALSRGNSTPQDLATAQGLIRSRAMSGDPLVSAAQQQQQGLIGGSMLGGNPYLDNVARNIGDRMGEAYATGTRGSMTANAQRSGNDPRYASAYGQNVFNSDRAFGDSLGATMSNLYANNYSQERAAQDAASRNATGLAQFNVNATNALQASGADQRQWPYQQLDYMRGAINPAFGSQTTNNQTGTANSFGQNASANTANTWSGMNQNGTTASNVLGRTTDSSTMQAPNNWMAGAGGAMSGAGLYRIMFPNG